MKSIMLRILLFLLLICQIKLSSSSDMEEADSIERRTALATTQLSLDIMRTIPASEGNSVMSPMSYQIVLNMLYLGSNGTIHQELARGLGYDSVKLRPQDPHDGMKNVLADIKRATSPDSAILSKINDTGHEDWAPDLKARAQAILNDIKPAVNFTLANLMLTSDALQVSKNYSSQLRQYYDIQMESFNTTTVSERELVDRVNLWVRTHTNSKIDKIVDKLDMNSLAFILLNAAYFKGEWAHPFDPKRNNEALFYENGLESSAKSTTFMRQKSSFGYLDLADLKHHDKELASLDCEALLMPFSHSTKLSMMILLPRARQGLDSVLRQITAKDLNRIYDLLEDVTVYVEIPKFKFEKQLDLKDVLIKLGIQKMFSVVSDGFKQISQSETYVSQLVHKATIEVTELGAEAAAVTMGVNTLRAIVKPAPTPRFIADHPFLFVILHNPSNMPLFIGRYTHV